MRDNGNTMETIDSISLYNRNRPQISGEIFLVLVKTSERQIKCVMKWHLILFTVKRISNSCIISPMKYVGWYTDGQ